MPPDIIDNNAPALSATTDLPAMQPAPVDTSTPVEPVAVPPAETAPSVVPEPTPATPPSDRTVHGRFSELATQRRDAELRAQRLETLASQQSEQISRLLETVSRINTPAVPEVPVIPTDFSESRPSRDAFDEPEAYEAALVSWAGHEAASKAASEMRRLQEESDNARAERERVAAETKAREESEARQREESNRLFNSWEEKRKVALEKYQDFDEITRNDDLPFYPGSPIAHAIFNNENGAELAYYLGKHPEEAIKIAQMTIPNQVFPPGTPHAGLPMWDFMAQAFELGKITSKLGITPAPVPESETPSVPEVSATTNVLTNPSAQANSPTPTPTVPVLPEPPTPFRGGQNQASIKDLTSPELSMEEYAARRTPQIIAERRPGRVFQ